MFSSVIMECFLGGGTKEKLEDQEVCLFMSQLIEDATKNSSDPAALLLGRRFVEAGIRAKDKSVNRRLKLFKEWGRKYVHNKVL